MWTCNVTRMDNSDWYWTTRVTLVCVCVYVCVVFAVVAVDSMNALLYCLQTHDLRVVPDRVYVLK